MNRTITLQLTDQQVEQMRTEIDRIPLAWAPPTITKILPQLPFTESVAALVHSGDSSPAPSSSPSGVASGFHTEMDMGEDKDFAGGFLTQRQAG